MVAVPAADKVSGGSGRRFVAKLLSIKSLILTAHTGVDVECCWSTVNSIAKVPFFIGVEMLRPVQQQLHAW